MSRRSTSTSIRTSVLRGFLGLGLAASLTLTACSSGGGDAEDAVRVGAILPLSGPAAELGKSWRAGIELAMGRINADGGITVAGEQRNLEVKTIDDESTPAGGQRAIQEFLAEDYQLFLGPNLSSSFATAYAVLKDDERRLVMTPALAAEPMLSGDNRLFKTQPSQSAEAVAGFAREFARIHEPERVAILEPKDPAGDVIVPALTEGFEDAGAEVVYQNQVTADTSDFLPIVSAMRKSEPDMIVTPYLDSVGAPFVTQAVQAGFTDPVFVNYGGSVAQVADAPEISPFTYLAVTRAVDNPDDETVAEFREAYEKKYDTAPKPIDFYALMFYDPLLMLAEAIEDAGTATDVEEIGKALKEVTAWDGQVLDFRFDDKGMIQLGTRQFVTITDGKTSYLDVTR